MWGVLNGFRELEALNAIVDLVAFEPEQAACNNLNKSIYPAAGFHSARAWPLALSGGCFFRSKNYELIDCNFTPEQVVNVGEKPSIKK